MEDREAMIDEACLRLNSTTKRGANAFKRVVNKLLEIGGRYDGPRDKFLCQISGSLTSNVEPLRILTSNKIIRCAGQGAGKYWLEFSEEGLKAFLSNPAKNLIPKQLRTPKRCPQCGSKAFQVVGEVCVGCHSRNSINRERKGFLKV